MKIKLTPTQASMLIKRQMLKHHPMKMNGKSAKILAKYLRSNKN